MIKTVISYNEREVREGVGSKGDINNGYNLWIDIIDPDSFHLQDIQNEFKLDNKTVEKIQHMSKKPQVRRARNHDFSIFTDLKFKNITNLQVNPIYFFKGKGWLITIHSNEVDILRKVRLIFTEQGERIQESSIDALYYSILSSIIETYEQIFTAIELKVFDAEKMIQYKPSTKILKDLDILSKQAILLRRHFWYARNVINYHTNMEEDKQDIKFLRIVYNDINHLIEMVHSYQDTIESSRDAFSNVISLQLNETVRLLTIFSAIILPSTLLTGILELEGFDLNNLAKIPNDFDILMLIILMITGTALLIFWRKRWILNKELRVDYGGNEKEQSEGF